MTLVAGDSELDETPVDPFAMWRDLQDVIDVGAGIPVAVPTTTTSAAGVLNELDDPHLVISDGYIGSDRRRSGLRAVLARTSYPPRRGLMRIEIAIVLLVAAMVAGAGLLVSNGGRPVRPTPTFVAQAAPSADTVRTGTQPPTLLAGSSATAPTTTPTTTPTTVPTTVPTTTPVAPAAVVVTTTPTTVPTTPEALGAAALTLVRYPWRQIPGYSIVFLPITDAPSPGFYGNTSFTWGQPGGTSTLYVFPGESVDQLAGIIAFEIGHEVDAAYVEPQAGHAQIESILGIYPPSWAPECDCAEQGYLSGWYASAFSNYWSPGVGDWSTLAPEPSGATLTAVAPWLNPQVS